LSDISEQERAFQLFLNKYGRNFGTKEEYIFRLEIFTKNYDIIKNFNSNGEGQVLAVNKFADMTEVEFKRYLGY